MGHQAQRANRECLVPDMSNPASDTRPALKGLESLPTSRTFATTIHPSTFSRSPRLFTGPSPCPFNGCELVLRCAS